MCVECASCVLCCGVLCGVARVEEDRMNIENNPSSVHAERRKPNAERAPRVIESAKDTA